MRGRVARAPYLVALTVGGWQHKGKSAYGVPADPVAIQKEISKY
jgi:hypothetical protein